MESNKTTNPDRAQWFLWSVIGLTALAAALRFSTLGLQSYRHDEAVTAGRVLVSSLSGTMHRVWTSESTPPLYYLLAWLWSHLFGVREVGLRSLSALIGTATVPVAYLAGRELIGRRVGLTVAAVVAVSPILVWYSQDARAYALLVLLCSAALLFFLRARRSGSARDLGWWAVFSALALATHYFAIFPLTIEALWLLARTRPLRRVLWALASVALAGLALAPIALHQAQGKNNNWIASFGLLRRLHDAGIAFFAGETGLLKHALAPIALFAAAVALLLWRGGEREKRGALVALAIGGGSVLLALLFAAAGQDYVLARNLLPALIPLVMVAAAGIAAPGSGRLGIAVGAALVLYLLAFCVYVDFRPALQREDWRSVAAQIGPPRGSPRAILVWEEGGEPLAFYIGHGENQVKWKRWRHSPIPVAEVDVVSGRPPPPRHRVLPPAFRQVERVRLGRMTLLRYRAPRPLALKWGQLIHNFTGYGNNAVLLDGPATGSG
ncbi:MAG: mannosyltransferase [Solirubrobacterales bacterium]|nr:mannosyltransferase [Solirubrobacterales bacterium]